MKKLFLFSLPFLLLGCGETKVKSVPVPYSESQIIIDLKDNLSEKEVEQFANDYNVVLHPTALYSETKEELVDVDAGSKEDLLARLQVDPRVEIAEPNYKVQALFTPNDPMFKQQWNMKTVRAEKAWDYTTGRGAIVAVVDTGVAYEDYNGFKQGSDLKGTQFVPGWNFVTNNEHANDDQSHGTHCTGTIAQSTDNGVGVAGLAFNAKVMPVKVLDSNGSGTAADVADGIRWAAEHGAQVISLSLGSDHPSKVEEKAIQFARTKGVVVIAAAGNSGSSVGWPAAFDGVVAVSASDPNDKLAKFSSRGKEVDIAAPGVDITQQTICDDGKGGCEEYTSYNGTSMATPHVAAVAALLHSLGVSQPDKVEETLKKTARVVDNSDAGKKLYGAGILDAGAAVSYTVWHHGLVRIGLLFGLTFILSLLLKGKGTSPYSWKYLVPGFFAGPGLLFFLPLVLSCISLPLDIASRALPDMDLIAGAAIHQYFPLANAVIPFLLMLLTWSFKQLRPAVAGLAVGMGAYLLSVVVLGDQFSQFGSTIQTIWCGLNVVGCMIIAKMNLSEAK